MCLVFVAFATWAVRTSDLHAPDAWKTGLEVLGAGGMMSRRPRGYSFFFFYHICWASRDKGTWEVQALFDLAFVIANLLPTYCPLKARLCRQKVARSQSWHSGYLVSLLQSCWPTLAPSLLSATSAARLGEGVMADQDPVPTQAQAARSQAGLVRCAALG